MKALNLYLWTHRRKLHDLPRVFRQNSESFPLGLQKNLLDWIFFKKVKSNCSSGQIGCSFVNQAESLSNVWKFFRKFWKPFWWKKSCLEKKHPEKLLRMQFSQSPWLFSEKIWNLPDQTRTPRLQISNHVDIFSVKNWWSSRSILKKRIWIFHRSDRFLLNIQSGLFSSNQFSLIVSLEMWNAVFKTFLRVFAENPGLFAQIPKLVMSSDFYPRKRKRCSGKTECSSQKNWRSFWVESNSFLFFPFKAWNIYQSGLSSKTDIRIFIKTNSMQYC